MKVLASIGAVALLAGSCGSDRPNSTGVRAEIDCDELADDVAGLMVDLAEHASRNGSGLPLGAFEVDHPDQIDVWEVAAAIAAGSADLEARVDAAATARREAGCEAGFAHDAVEQRLEQALREGRRRASENIRPDEYTILNLLAVLAGNLAPPPERYQVPEGFPPEFPVHPEAVLVSRAPDADGSVRATWTIDGTSFEEVSDYYDDRLQEIRFGGWNIRSSSSSGGVSADGSDEGSREHLELEGYGFAGQVTIATRGSGGGTVVIAELSPRR